jgi:rfaE bifunctional protein nucleotidyltransferase chain/domain
MGKNWKEESQKKFVQPDQLKHWVEGIRKEKKTIATLNGSFDLLHAGHLEILYAAALQADVLLVALNSDESIRQYKSLHRPIISLDDRLRMMAAIEFVDFVTWFEETDPIKFLEIVKPDVHVNGSEYGENCIEASTVKAQGGKIHIVSLVPGLSTTQIVQKIKTCR